MNKYDQRQLKLMIDKAYLYKSNKITILQLINDLESLFDVLQEKEKKWSAKFLDLWENLEILYACSLDQNEKIIKQENLKIIDRTVSDIIKLIDGRINENNVIYD